MSVYISLGSNKGERLAYIKRALTLLEEVEKLEVERVSSIQETQPWGVADQDKFLDCVVRLKSNLAPEDLLSVLKQIEEEVGRTPSQRWGPREIDLDILLYNDEVVDTPTLEIPHPRLQDRKFLLKLFLLESFILVY